MNSVISGLGLCFCVNYRAPPSVATRRTSTTLCSQHACRALIHDRSQCPTPLRAGLLGPRVVSPHPQGPTTAEGEATAFSLNVRDDGNSMDSDRVSVMMFVNGPLGSPSPFGLLRGSTAAP